MKKRESEFPHSMFCFQHGGSEACEIENRKHGFTCPKCFGDGDDLHPLTELARDIVKEVFPCHMEIGKALRHPDGRIVKIKSGYFFDPVHGRVSNYWTWNEVRLDGSLGPDESGYGW